MGTIAVNSVRDGLDRSQVVFDALRRQIPLSSWNTWNAMVAAVCLDVRYGTGPSATEADTVRREGNITWTRCVWVVSAVPVGRLHSADGPGLEGGGRRDSAESSSRRWQAPVTAGEGQDLAVRRETIKSLVLQDGFARIEDLTKLFGVSLMTVHRDLDALSHQGYLTKIRGGATANPNALIESRVNERVVAMKEEKSAIAAHAAKLLSPGQTVFVDDSTTAMAMVPHLIASAPITVATNFLPVIGQLAGVAGVELIVLGGMYHSVPEACFGSRTVESISHLHADLALMSTTGINGISCYHRSEITVTSREAFMANSTMTVLLVDHAKFGRPATHLLCRLTEFDLVITDTGIDHEDEQLLRSEGINLELAPARVR